MIISPATVHDIATIQTLAYTIWPTAYGSILSREQIAYMLNLFYNEQALLTQMQEGQKFIFAKHNNLAVGFTSYSYISQIIKIVKLHKLYALPNQLVKGIGSCMLSFVCEEAKKMEATQVILNVNKYNTATQFYSKMGFTIQKEEVIDIGNNYVMDDYVMVKNVEIPTK